MTYDYKPNGMKIHLICILSEFLELGEVEIESHEVNIEDLSSEKLSD